MSDYYQQGDVLLFPIQSIPRDAQERKHAILAEGEATGHSHQAIGDGVRVLALGEDLYISAPRGATVVHQEHGPITLPVGNYQRRIVREYDHLAEEARNVVD